MVAQRIIQYWVEHFNVILAQGMGIWTNQSSKVKMPRGVPKGGCWRFEMINTLLGFSQTAGLCYVKSLVWIHRIKKMVNFKLSNKVMKEWSMFFILSQVWNTRKILSPHGEFYLRPVDSTTQHSTSEIVKWASGSLMLGWYMKCLPYLITISNVSVNKVKIHHLLILLT